MNKSLLRSVKNLPSDFILGAATAAYQVEGATHEDGKGINMWDSYLSNHPLYDPDPASDFYHRYPEDIKLAKKYGLNAIRLSISWVRIFPDFDDHQNKKGIEYYHKLFNTCIEAGITPYVALHHFDSPQKMIVSGDWLNRANIDKFVKYATFCFNEFPEVTHWFTINEMISLASGQYIGGEFPPNHKNNLTEAIQAEHNMLLAHAKTVLAYHSLNLSGKIGCIHALKPGFPNSDNKETTEAAKKYDAYNNKFLMDGTFLGYYQDDTLNYLNQVLKENNSTIEIYPEDLKIMKHAAPKNDMFGMNYYRSEFIDSKDGERIKGIGNFVKRNDVPKTEWGWNIYPEGLYKMLMRIKHDYPSTPPILITENGIGLKESAPKKGTILQDDKRIEFLDDHLYQLLKAKHQGVDIKGYFVWSLQDQFSWVNGYGKRYGLFYVNFSTQERFVKKSACWIRELSETIETQ